MVFLRTKFALIGCVLLMAVVLGYTRTNEDLKEQTPTSSTAHTKAHSAGSKKPASTASSRSRRHKKSRKSARARRGQQKIDSQRAQEIQRALIHEHYLSGEPSGVWDDATQKAMQKYQAANGWQTKTTPDARALIKLGLGPDNGHLLNPETAMTSEPHPATPASGAGSPDPNGTPQPQK